MSAPVNKKLSEKIRLLLSADLKPISLLHKKNPKIFAVFLVAVFLLFAFIFSYVINNSRIGKTSDVKRLYWENVSVKTRLLADGSLDVTEEQLIVFTGDWNGAYRDVNLLPGQSVRFISLQKYEPVSGVWQDLQAGNIDLTDHYIVENEKYIRWRSRLPSDPVFNNQKILYRLHYRISGLVWVQAGSEYIFDYNFLFPDRDDVVQKFHGEFYADDVWQIALENGSYAGADQTPLLYEGNDLPPGNSQYISLGLHYGGTLDLPVTKIASRQQVLLLQLFLIGVLSFFSVRYYFREKKLGRFVPIEKSEKVVQQWVSDYVLAFLPEEVGALWDGEVGPSEVSAILARLVVEKKISSELENTPWLSKSPKSMRLKLLVPRNCFSGYDRRLVNGIFVDGDETSSARIAAYYRKRRRSFSPVNLIAESIWKSLAKQKLFRDRRNFRPWLWIPLVLALLALLIYTVKISEQSIFIALTVILPTILLTFTSQLFLDNLENSLGSGWKIMSRLVAGIFFPALIFILLTRFDSRHEPSFLLASYLLVAVVLCLIILFKSSKNSPEKIVWRRRLWAVRNYWKNELQKNNPDLKDEYFPWLLALDLAPAVDQWSYKFSSPVAPSTGRMGGANAGLAGAGSWSGGGGAFGGAGASGSWGMAANAVGATTVSPPRRSSSDSSSSRGSGGSGGGGGW